MAAAGNAPGLTDSDILIDAARGFQAADERAWAQASIRSLAKYWDTPEEDMAWAYLQADDLADEREFWYRLSDQGLAMAYGDDEPDYSLAMIKESNPKYE